MQNEHPRIKRGTALIAQKTRKDIVVLSINTSDKFLYINQPIYNAGNKTVLYSIEYLGKINVCDYIEKYNDDVTLKSKITKFIIFPATSKILSNPILKEH